MDVSNFFTWFISLMADGVTFCFGLLDSVEFLGTTLLEFLIGLFIIGAIIPILLTLLRNRSFRNSGRPDSRRSDQKGANDE